MRPPARPLRMHPGTPSSTDRSTTRHPADPRLVWRFYGCGAAIALALGAVALWTPGPASVSATDRNWMAAIGALQALAFLVCAWTQLRARRTEHGVVFACFSALMSIAAASVFTAPDAALQLLGLTGFLACVCAVFGTRRAAIVLTALALGAVAGVAAHRPGMSGLAIAVAPAAIVAGLLIGLMSKASLQNKVAALRQREQRFHGLLNIGVDRYWELDAEMRFTVLAGAGETPIPSGQPSPLGLRPWETPGTFGASETDWAAHRKLLEAHRPFRNFVVGSPDPAGGTRWFSISGEPIFDTDGRFTGYWGVSRIITAEVMAQRAIRAMAERYRQLFERSPSPMIVHRQSRLIHVNEAAAQLLGYRSAAAALGADLRRHYDEPERARALERVRQLESLPVGEPLPLTEFEVRRVDGAAVQVQVTSLRIELDDGPAVLSIYQDLTARKTAEQALRHSQTLLERLFDVTPDVVTLAEYETGRYLMVNERFTQALGWTRAEALGRSTMELGIYHEAESRERLRTQLVERGSMRDELMTFRCKDGVTVVPMRISAALLTFDAVKYVVAVARDVSRAEQTRQEHEAILRYASVGIGFTRDRRIVQANPHFEAMFGWPIGGLVGQPGEVVWPSPDEYEEVGLTAGPLLAAGQPFEAERLMRRRDGSSFWCHLSARAVDPGDPSRGGTIWICEDVTERRIVQESLAAARDAAEAASRAKSAFLANTSHEIRTPLNGLLGLAQLARRADVQEDERRRLLDQILDSARTLSGVITDILDLSKIEAGRLSVEAVAFDLHQLLHALCDSSEALAIARGLKLHRAIDPALPQAVRGDPVRVRQIIANFLNNALKFTERGEINVIATRGPGDLVHVVVADTGPGIDEATQARLFRPFVQADDSTTRRYGGTGLGLSICRELATLMGGAVGVGSSPRRGSRFWADLPLPAVDAAELRGADPSGFDEPVAGAHVLVVEDNSVNLLIVRAMLEGWGIEVDEAGDGAQAIDAVVRAARRGRPFDAVLMDVQMPVMSGHDAARELRRKPEGAGLPIIALTAAALVSERDRALASGMDAFLTKPVDAAQLRQALGRVLFGRVRA